MAVQYQNKVILARDVKVTRGLAGSVHDCLFPGKRPLWELLKSYWNDILASSQVKVSHGCFQENLPT